ncbi:MAG: ATP synthase F1 subunit epsilon [Lachnospiraceae bacterium]
MADEKSFHLKVITPDRSFYDNDVHMVEFNTIEGELGIYPGHLPMTVIIKPGVLVITEGEEKKRAALHSGFVEILPDEITILAEVIEWPEEIDQDRAEAAKERATKKLAEQLSNTELAKAETALARSVARISVLK